MVNTSLGLTVMGALRAISREAPPAMMVIGPAAPVTQMTVGSWN
jgi:hypothetical protein